MAMEKQCKICGKPISFERAVTEVSCPFCYTDFRVVNGQLREIDLDGGSKSAPKASAPTGKSSASPPPAARNDLARFLDDGNDQHLTFVKDDFNLEAVKEALARSDRHAAKPAKRPKSDAAPSRAPEKPASRSASLEFADDDDDASGAKPAAKPIAAPVAVERPAAPANEGGKKKRKKKKNDPPDYTIAPEAIVGAPPDDDAGQKRLLAAVLGIVAVIAIGGISAVAILLVGIIDATPPTPMGGPSNDDVDDLRGPAAPVFSGDTLPVNDLIDRAHTAMQGGTLADACEAVLLLEAAQAAPHLDRADRSRIESELRDAYKVRDGYRMATQVIRAADRATQADSDARKAFETYFFGEILSHARHHSASGSKNFTRLREEVNLAAKGVTD